MQEYPRNDLCFNDKTSQYAINTLYLLKTKQMDGDYKKSLDRIIFGDTDAQDLKKALLSKKNILFIYFQHIIVWRVFTSIVTKLYGDVEINHNNIDLKTLEIKTQNGYIDPIIYQILYSMIFDLIINKEINDKDIYEQILTLTYQDKFRSSVLMLFEINKYLLEEDLNFVKNIIGYFDNKEEPVKWLFNILQDVQDKENIPKILNKVIEFLEYFDYSDTNLKRSVYLKRKNKALAFINNIADKENIKFLTSHHTLCQVNQSLKILDLIRTKDEVLLFCNQHCHLISLVYIKICIIFTMTRLFIGLRIVYHLLR